MPTNFFSELLGALLDESEGEVSQILLARALKVSQSTVAGWVSGATPSRATIRRVLNYFRDYSASSLIKPVIEFQPIAPMKSGRTWVLSRRENERDHIHESLLHRVGVFILYDSAGNAIYLGKSESCLYTELKRRLSDQVDKPLFAIAKPKTRQIGEMVCYLSAYEVSIKAAVKTVETFALRAFGNQLLNERGEGIKGKIRLG